MAKETNTMTLHEIAHAIAFLDLKAMKHCYIFVKVIDDLAVSEWLWKKETS